MPLLNFHRALAGLGLSALHHCKVPDAVSLALLKLHRGSLVHWH
jgi:hypothetical protein